jgi:hypothetical protein
MLFRVASQEKFGQVTEIAGDAAEHPFAIE